MNNRALVLQAVPEQPASSHGTRGGYNTWGCRCEACAAAEHAYTVKRNARETAASREGKALRGRA